jgi:L-asparaginase
MNNDIHLGRYVYKGDSQLTGAFRSHPAPLGQVRAGRPVLYYSPPPAPLESLADFSQVTAAKLRARVPIWTLTAGAFLPEELLEAGLDGLVLAGSGEVG